MNAYGLYLAALHQQDLLEEARLNARVKLVKSSQPRTPAWRRTVSDALTSAARRLDPTVEVVRSTRLSNGQSADLLPAC